MTTQQLIEQALALPQQERAIIADSILRSLHAPDPNIDKQWATEAQQRLDQLRSGEVTPIPGDQVFKEIREQFKF